MVFLVATLVALKAKKKNEHYWDMPNSHEQLNNSNGSNQAL